MTAGHAIPLEEVLNLFVAMGWTLRGVEEDGRVLARVSVRDGETLARARELVETSRERLVALMAGAEEYDPAPDWAAVRRALEEALPGGVPKGKALEVQVLPATDFPFLVRAEGRDGVRRLVEALERVPFAEALAFLGEKPLARMRTPIYYAAFAPLEEVLLALGEEAARWVEAAREGEPSPVRLGAALRRHLEAR